MVRKMKSMDGNNAAAHVLLHLKELLFILVIFIFVMKIHWLIYSI